MRSCISDPQRTNSDRRGLLPLEGGSDIGDEAGDRLWPSPHRLRCETLPPPAVPSAAGASTLPSALPGAGGGRPSVTLASAASIGPPSASILPRSFRQEGSPGTCPAVMQHEAQNSEQQQMTRGRSESS